MSKNMLISCEAGNVFIPKVVKKAVFLLHGFGSCGEDMFGLVPIMAQKLPDTAFFCPNAGEGLPQDIQTHEQAYQWFSLLDELNIVAAGKVEDFQELAYTIHEKAKPAYKGFSEYADSVKRQYGLTNKDIAFAGFSQGAEVAIGAAFSNDEPVAAVVGFSPMTCYFFSGAILSSSPLLLIHGDKDNVIPYSIYKMTLNLLKQNSIKYERFVMKDCGHFISDEAVLKAIDFLKCYLLSVEKKRGTGE